MTILHDTASNSLAPGDGAQLAARACRGQAGAFERHHPAPQSAGVSPRAQHPAQRRRSRAWRDAARGAALYARCAGCHSLAADRTGPRHCGLPGRRAGAGAAFAYSPAMAKAGLVWNDDTWSATRATRRPPCPAPA
ncbi:c-type cytochrome [Ramlibacter sp.]|uniref:c-type cytochrome n=1 Tax=Ramlibacter sp. TaxID=1917967 RepID=UPI00260D7230|nr:c-type cytochrome [Ramlibacter sp.]